MALDRACYVNLCFQSTGATTSAPSKTFLSRLNRTSLPTSFAKSFFFSRLLIYRYLFNLVSWSVSRYSYWSEHHLSISWSREYSPWTNASSHPASPSRKYFRIHAPSALLAAYQNVSSAGPFLTVSRTIIKEHCCSELRSASQSRGIQNCLYQPRPAAPDEYTWHRHGAWCEFECSSIPQEL